MANKKGFDKMDKEKMIRIGKFLNDRLIIHRNIENDSSWTTEEKMIQELYDNYLDLLIQNRKLEQALDENEKLINTILNFSFFEEECPLSFEFETISKEDKAQKIFYNDEYCEKNCNDNYKNCWLKYFKELQKAKGDVKNENNNV